MKKLFLAFTITGLITACDSNKKSSNAGSYTSAPTPKTISNSNNVSRVNEPAEIVAPKTHAPKTHLDSMLMNSNSGAEKQSSSYNSNSTYHNGASGVGTGSSYAGHAYAKLRYKKKPKYTKSAVPPMEEEISDNVKVTDSTGTVNKQDSISVNKGW
ncbi:MAG TPA: hypothetical protein VNW99_07150 [Cytophagaceae bacterium]|jgi:hypothetical protein|nr:hypothetical protein [Cytophagaceae bacterium]